MIIDCISDLHGYLPNLEGGDLLIVAGDLTALDTQADHDRFNHWADRQKYRKIVFIAGNHDGLIEKQGWAWLVDKYKPLKYLEDTSTTFEGLKIWGSPWTPTFLNWHFMKDRGKDIAEKWAMIPDDVDILITHGPPWGILDEFPDCLNNHRIFHAGCMDLFNEYASKRIKPKLHVFGHIHEGYGQMELNGTIFVNASIMNEHYKPVNKPIRVIL